MLKILKQLFRRRPRAPLPEEDNLQAAVAGKRQAEDWLRESQEHFEQLVAGVRDYAVFLLDREGHVRTWNAGAERIKGYRAKEIIGEHFSRFYPKEAVASGWPAHELSVAATTGRFEDEGWRVRKDGTRFWANVVITALKDASGGTRGFLKITRDLTERRQAEENARRLVEEEAARRTAEAYASEIERQREQLHVILQSIGDAVIATDAAGRVTLLNPVAEALTGWPRDEAVGQLLETALPLINERTREPVENPVAKVLREGTTVGLANHTVLIARDGTERPIDDSAAPIYNEKGETIGVVLVFRDVAEKRAAEVTLRTSEERLRLALEAGRMGVWEWNLRTHAVWWSDNLEAIHGLKSGTFGGTLEAFEALVHPNDRELVHRALSGAVAARSELDIEFRNIWPDDSVHWMVGKGKVFCDDSGEPLRMVGVGMDVTGRKRAEQELREAERWFKAVFNQQFQFMAILAADGTVLDANDTCFRVTGIERQAVLGRLFWEAPWWELLPAMQEWWKEHLADAVRSGGPITGEVDYCQADGSLRHADVVLTGLKDDAGRVVSVIVEGRDVTDRRRHEEALAASEERWRTMAEALPNLVWTDVANGECDWLSSQWRKYTGIPENELLGLRWLERVVHPDDRERTRAAWQAACADVADYDLEYRIRRQDGEYHWFKTRGVPVRNERGKIVYWFGTCTDIEDVKRLEAALREQDRRKNEFLAILAHELRNPLAPLRTGLQVLRLSGDPAKLEEARGMMERQLGQMVRLIDDLLDISRISCNKLELRKAHIALTAVVENAVETARPLIDSKGQTLIVALPPGPIYLDADMTRLAQVFWNLLNNSAKYTDPGGRIELSAHTNGDAVVLTVRDTGIGIPAQALPGLFNLFSQVGSSLDRSQGGLGIGLALVKGLVEMHGGTVAAHSDGVGRGSEFVVHLPLAQAQENDVALVTPKSTAEAPRRRILIVDDNRDGAATLGMLLALLGHDTRTAHDGLAALELAEVFRPDVILLDIGLPRLNGYEVARRIREQPWGQEMVLIAVTGWGQEEDKRRSQEAGFNFHMVKPVEPAELENLLSEVLMTR
jgi:PAS domain S-box-containing protein